MTAGDPSSDTMPNAAVASPELTGGAGFTFEAGVAAGYLVALLTETTAPGLNGRLVERVSLQQGALGYPLDDVIVEGRGADEISCRLSLQVKRRLVVSSAESNSVFRDIVLRAHATLVALSFTLGVDRVGAVVGTISEGSLRDFTTLCDWARFEASAEGLVQKLSTPEFAGEKTRQFEGIKQILADVVTAGELDAVAHKLLGHFVLIRYEMVGEASVDESGAITRLADVMHTNDRARAASLWQALLGITRLGAGYAAVLDRKTLVARLGGAFRLRGAASLAHGLSVLTEEAKRAAAEIGTDVAGHTIQRPTRVAAVRAALADNRFVQIGGLPGSGKSAVLRSMVEQALHNGSTLFLKGDRLAGNTWAQYAAAMGLGTHDLETLLVEIEVTGTPILFIDGLDRVERNYRGVVCDLLNILLGSDKLAKWRVVATVRDTGIEPVRVWLPRALTGQGAPVVDVAAFDEAESQALALQVPALEPLLLGSDSVKAIVRRPFFAAVMAQHPSFDGHVPRSEIELANVWWERGGYAAEAASALRRQQSLVALAKNGAISLGRSIAILGLDPVAISELEADGIIRQVRSGQTARFVHDIYFEWSFLQLLVSRGEQWLEVVREVGEPPVLGRVVELLSQIEVSEGQCWQQQLERLEQRGDVRSQWLRAWMTGPVGLPTLRNHEAIYNAAMLADGGRRVARLAVWVQAEKTRPNSRFLESEVLPHLELPERIRLADLLACPSDFQAWRRLCHWLFRNIDTIQRQWWPEVLTVFEVWQNAAADFDNPLSKRIVTLCRDWLQDIELRYHSSGWPKDHGDWDQISYDAIEDFESRLRNLVLRAARSYPDSVREYLHHLRQLERLPRTAFKEIVSYSTILAEVCGSELVDFCLDKMRRSLPVDIWRRTRDSMYGRDIHSEEWHSLAIDDEHSYFPSAPTREPFPSLFRYAPAEARRLVRELANHATRAWRQLHRLDSRERGTPVPLTLNFPWDRQTFWGGAQQYLWSRGIWGSHAVGCGLMALESWAFGQVEAGRPVDEILGEVLAGHDSCGALGVAAAVAMESMHRSEATLPILTCQRMWHWDIARYVHDTTSGASLIGFDRDDVHYQAVVASNGHRCRKTDVRGLASAMVIHGGDLGSRASAAVLAFADELPVDYAEIRYDVDAVRQLKRTAELWAEVGRKENYKASVAEDRASILIEHDNPKANGPDIDAINQRRATMDEQLGPLLWAQECLEKGVTSTRMSVNEALDRVRHLYSEGMFSEAHSQVDERHQRQAAVAGVAAATLRLSEDVNAEQLTWAAEICLTAWKTPERPEDFFTRHSSLLFHPVLYAVKGLSGLLRRTSYRMDALAALIEATAHPYDQIKTEAIAGLVSLWDVRPELGWLGLQLACDLALVQPLGFHATPEERAAEEARHINNCVERAFDLAQSLDGINEPLPSMPPAWVPTQGERRTLLRRRGREVAIEWEHHTIELDWSLMAKVLESVPVSVAMADATRRTQFLAWCEELVRWTVDRLSPDWSRQPGQTALEDKNTEMYEWRRDLYRFLAKVSLHLDAQDAYRRFIAPAAATGDETFTSLAQPVVWILACAVMDEPEFPPRPLELLELVIPRMVEHSDWSYARRDDGHIHDSDLARMVRAIFFVEVEKAMGAARFANGNWQEVARVLPLIEPFLSAAGTSQTVTSAYATLCERAFGAFPLEAFVEYIPKVIGNRVGLPSGWRRTSLPARLADLIQRYSESVQPLPIDWARVLLKALDALVDMGDRRAAAVQCSETFKDVRLG